MSTRVGLNSIMLRYQPLDSFRDASREEATGFILVSLPSPVVAQMITLSRRFKQVSKALHTRQIGLVNFAVAMEPAWYLLLSNSLEHHRIYDKYQHSDTSLAAVVTGDTVTVTPRNNSRTTVQAVFDATGLWFQIMFAEPHLYITAGTNAVEQPLLSSLFVR